MVQLLIARALIVLFATGVEAVSLQNASSTASSTTTSVNVGSFILQGLGATSSSQSDTSTSTLSGTSSSIASSTSQASRNTTSSPTKTIVVPDANVQWSTNLFQSEYVGHARSCWSAYTSWYASYPGYYYTANVSISTKEVLTTEPGDPFPFSQTFWPTEAVSTYKLCDGTPRATFSPSTTFYSTSIPFSYTDTITLSPSIPSPPCTLDQEDCAVAYYGANIKSMPLEGSGASAFAHSRLLGACGLPLDSDLGCLVQGGPVQLFYFPVTTKGGLCDSNGTTVTNTEEQAPITTLGTTFQPGSVYMSFSTLYAAYRRFTAPGGPAVQVGPTFSNTIFAFKSEEVSTNCYVSSWGDMSATSGATEPGYGPGTQLNYADLNSPVPASAYQCQNQCKPSSTYIGSDGEFSSTAIHPNPCNTIYDNFNPLLAMPTRLRDMVPEWSTCEFWNYQQANIVFDPPTALRQVSSAAQPTLPTKLTTTAASPSPTRAPPASSTATATQNVSPASHTSSAQEDNLPSTSQGAVSSNNGQQSPVQVSSDQPASAPAATTVAFTPVASQGTPASAAPSVAQSDANTAAADPAQPSSQQAAGLSVLSAAENSAKPAATTVQFSQAGLAASTAAIAQSGNGDPIQQTTNAAIAAITLGGTTITASQVAARVVVNGTTISNGQALTVDGSVLSAGPSGLVVSPETANGASSGSAEVLAAGSVTITASLLSAGAAVVDGTTLSFGGSALTVSGEIISMGSQGLVGIQSATDSTGSGTRTSSRSSHVSKTGSASMASTARSSTFDNAATASAASSGADVGKIVHLSSLVIMAVVVTVARHMLV